MTPNVMLKDSDQQDCECDEMRVDLTQMMF